jgi:hypothetical protein
MLPKSAGPSVIIISGFHCTNILCFLSLLLSLVLKDELLIGGNAVEDDIRGAVGLIRDKADEPFVFVPLNQYVMSDCTSTSTEQISILSPNSSCHQHNLQTRRKKLFTKCQNYKFHYKYKNWIQTFNQ